MWKRQENENDASSKHSECNRNQVIWLFHYKMTSMYAVIAVQSIATYSGDDYFDFQEDPLDDNTALDSDDPAELIVTKESSAKESPNNCSAKEGDSVFESLRSTDDVSSTSAKSTTISSISSKGSHVTDHTFDSGIIRT